MVSSFKTKLGVISKSYYCINLISQYNSKRIASISSGLAIFQINPDLNLYPVTFILKNNLVIFKNFMEFDNVFNRLSYFNSDFSILINLNILFFFFILIFILINSLKYKKVNNYKLLYFFYIILILLTLVTFASIKLKITSLYFLNSLFISNKYIISCKLLLLAFSIILLNLSNYYQKQVNSDLTFLSFEFSLCKLFVLFGLFISLNANDFLILFLGLELINFSLYIMAAFNTKSILSIEAGVKYFILGAPFTLIFSFSLFLIYSNCKSLIFNDVFCHLAQMKDFSIYSGIYSFETNFLLFFENFTLLFGVILLVFFFLFKLGAAPLHFWVPDVYQGSVLKVTAFFSTIAKFGVFCIFTKIIFYVFFPFFSYIQFFLIISTIFSLIFGSFGGLLQYEFKRLFAYSGISQLGFALAGFCSGDFYGLLVGLNFMFVYVINSLLIFATLICNQSYLNMQVPVYFHDFNKIVKGDFLKICGFTLALFSLAGIPPLPGFFSKYFILTNTAQSGFFIALTLPLIFFSIISCFYYMRLIKIINFEDNKKLNKNSVIDYSDNSNFYLVFILFIVFSIIFLINPEVLLNFWEFVGLSCTNPLSFSIHNLIY